MTGAGGVDRNPPAVQAGDAPANGSPALHSTAIRVAVVHPSVARALVERWHYLHTMPAGTKLAIGAVTFGVGPMSGHRLLRDARPQDGITLRRFVLLPERPANAASRVLGVVLRMIRRETDKKFVLTYADPEHGHHGVSTRRPASSTSACPSRSPPSTSATACCATPGPSLRPSARTAASTSRATA